MIRVISYLLILILVQVLLSCTGMKNITSADPLFIGSEIKFTTQDKNEGKLKPVIKIVLQPEPNHKFLWMRPALARNNMLSDSAKTKKFWKNKIAEPVLLSKTDPNQVSATIQNRIFHNGYFFNTVTFDTILAGQRKAKYIYYITPHEPYKIESVAFPKPQNDLTQTISNSKDESLLKSGDIYSLEKVKNERIRIDEDLKEHGYIYFSPDFITLKADSITGEHEIRAEITIKPETPPESRIPYTIGKVFINDDYVLDDHVTDTLQFGDYYLISRSKALSFNALQHGIFLKPGELYANSNHMHTIRYLNELPIIRSANIKFSPQENTDKLDASLYLSHRQRFAYSAEFNTVFRSTNYFGPGIIFSYTDRNVSQGAEMMKVNLRASFETQIADGEFNFAYELGLGVDYTVPRFYPGFLVGSGRKALPKTIISLGYNLFNRLDLYRLNSAVINFGYSWSKSNQFHHSFNPVEISFTHLPEESKSQEFLDYLEENPGVQRSFDEQFILGMGYEFTYDPSTGRQNDFFFRGGIDLAGNLLDAVYSISDATKDSLGRYELFGVPFSQYVRTRVDIRNGFNFNQKSSIVARLSAGVGIPFGNSDILPYIKQFYVGGTNSLRSFIARSVGPGSEVPPEGYNDVTGDIRLEGNLEYRFELAGQLRGALFIDAGNIWLFNEDPARPNGNFHPDSFLDEIAMSYGWGLRWDFDFIVARLDFAYTLRTPYLPEGERWTDGFDFWDPVLSIAIGYPF